MEAGIANEMNCAEIQFNLSGYLDRRPEGGLTHEIERHLASCPLCRQQFSDLRSLRDDLRMLSRPGLPPAIAQSIKLKLRDEIRIGRTVGISSSAGEWIRLRLMPISVGVIASVVVGLSFISLLFSGRSVYNGFDGTVAMADRKVLIAPDGVPIQKADDGFISASDYARNRLAFAGDSPSINPHGALISLSRSLLQSGIKNDEVVVVADVFSNGLARIAEVVEPSHDSKAMDDLEKALVSDPSNAPFVPADLDKRSDNVRVVLKFQSVEVNTRRSRR